MLKRLFLRLISPTGIIWLLIHFVILLVGFLLVHAEAIHSFLGSASLSIGVGGSLIATGAAGFALFIYLSFTDSARQKLQMFVDAGIVNIFDARSTRIKQEYDSRISTAKEIDIIGFGLSSFREDYKKDFGNWSHRTKTRILLIDPEYPGGAASYAKQRDKEEGNKIGKIGDDVKMFIEAIQEIKNFDRENFQVKLMKTLPSINIFRMDDEIFFGPYLLGDQSRNMPTFVAKRGGFLFRRLESHFDQIWSDAEFSKDALQ